jgi:hypothetical protein
MRFTDAYFLGRFQELQWSSSQKHIKEQIILLGEVIIASHDVDDPNDVCKRIRKILREEIKAQLISARVIYKYCPKAWKKKTSPNTKVAAKDCTNAIFERKDCTATPNATMVDKTQC